MKKNNTPSGELFEKAFEEEQQKRVEKIESEAKRREAEERTESKRRRRMVFRVITTFLLIVVVLIVLLVGIYLLFFRISELKVVGSEHYTAEQIFEAAEVKKGDHLYSFSSKIARDKLKSRLPYIKSLKVKRDIPGTITFTVEEHTPRFYSYVYGRTCVLSDDLTVIGILPGTDKRDDLCFLALPAVKRAVCGSKLEMRSEIDQTHVESVTGYLLASEIIDRVTALNASDTYALTMECDRRYLLIFGNYSECEIKLRLASAVLKDSLFEDANKRRVDLSDTSKTEVMIDNSLEFH